MKSSKGQEFNITGLYKIWTAVSIGIVIIGAIIIAAFGFNLGVDFAGGTAVEVEVGAYISEDNYAEFETIVGDVLGDLNLKHGQIKELSKNGTLYGLSVVLNTKEGTGTVEEKILAKIREKRDNGTFSNIPFSGIKVKVNPIEASRTVSVLWNALLILGVTLVAAGLYTFIRFGLRSALAVIISLFHNVLVTAALAAICRVTVNASFVPAVLAVLAVSVYDILLLLARIKENREKPAYSGATLGEVANVSVRENLLRSAATSVAAVLALGIIAIFAFSVAAVLLPVVIGLIVSGYCTHLLTPSLWTLIEGKGKGGVNEQKPKKVKKEKTEGATI